MIVDVDPKVDYAFKHLFGREATRPILIDVLDKVLNPDPGHHILEVELLNPFNPKEALDDKLSILDIKARDQEGRQFNVEMQMSPFPYYEKRILYYSCKLHQQQLHEGQDYLELKPTISISFLDHVWFPRVPEYHLRFRLLEESHRFPLTEDLEFHVLELPKFTKSAAELTNGLDVWLYFLRNAAMMDTESLPTALREPLVVRALEELKMLKQADPERERYEARRKAQLDDQTRLKVARLEGRQEGREEGRQEGREEGRQEGREEGRQEGRIEEKIATLHFFERLLNRPETPTQELAALPLDELTRLEEELQEQVSKRAKPNGQ
ncbi:MAG TPA: Rpn family recombination-promoting nuclease/putative transposase [Pirellulales bacterium]|nr:Rpn family recombination-promoting nuclease/putative transposase [Pirellulales bacterium]